MQTHLIAKELPSEVSLLPGGHLVLLSGDPLASLGLRKHGLEIRDTLLVLGPTGTMFAFLARMPVEGTVAENVLQHGTGALWIDGCRLSLRVGEDPDVLSQRSGGKRGLENAGFVGSGNENRPLLAGWDVSKGRWPTNLVFVHGEGCRQEGTRKVPSQNPTVKKPSPSRMFTDYGWRDVGQQIGYGDADGTETVAAWSCQQGCPVLTLDRQSGLLTSGAVAPHHMKNYSTQPSRGGFEGGFDDYPLTGYGDSGGASRFFPQFRNTEELESWLERLLIGPT